MTVPDHPLLSAIEPLLRRIGATVVPPQAAGPLDVPLAWDGEPLAAVRLPSAGPGGTLGPLLAQVQIELGTSLAELDRAGKQRAVRLLDQRGAFAIRKSVDTVAEALGVTRFTIYNYLNRAERS